MQDDKKTTKKRLKVETGVHPLGVKRISEVEEITQEQTGAIDLHLKSPEDLQATIKKEVAKFNSDVNVPMLPAKFQKLDPVKKLGELKKILSGYTIFDENDVAGYKKMDDARKMLVKLRTGFEAKRKDLKANYLAISRAIDGKGNSLIELVEEMETPFKQRLKEIDDIKKAAEEKAEREKREKTEQRVKYLIAYGIKFDGSFYSIGETISLDIVTIATLTDNDFQKLAQKVAEEGFKIEQAEKKAAQRVRVDRYLFERQQRKQKAEAEKLQAERDEMKRTRANMRIEVLKMLNFKDTGTYFIYSSGLNSVHVAKTDIQDFDADNWNERFEALKSRVESIEKETKVAIEKTNRTSRMESAGYLFNQKTNQFYLTTRCYGDTNFFNAQTVFEIEDFENWFNTVAAVDAKKTINDAKKWQDEQETIKKRTEQRIAELVNGFGMTYTDGQHYKRLSKYYRDEDFTEFLNMLSVSRETLETFDENQWSVFIQSLQAEFSQVQQAEQKIKDRLEKEAEDARVALLSEKDQVAEYVSMLENVSYSFTLKDKRLTTIVNDIFAAFKQARTELGKID